MNKEIKEILDRLERIDYKEYSCGFDFADSATFNEMARCFEERKKMADYITNLEQELEEEKKIPEKLEILQFSDLIDMSNGEIMQVIKDQRFKINEILNYLDYLKSKGE